MLTKLIKEKIKYLQDYKTKSSALIAEYLDDILFEYKNRLNNGWISVDDKLPKEYQSVLLVGRKPNGESLLTNGCLVQGLVDRYGVNEGFSAKMFVTHWQPLPKPPKGLKYAKSKK